MYIYTHKHTHTYTNIPYIYKSGQSQISKEIYIFLKQLHANPCWIQDKVSSTVSILMDQIVSTLPAISTVNLAFVWRVRPDCFAKPVATGTTPFLCVEVFQ